MFKDLFCRERFNRVVKMAEASSSSLVRAKNEAAKELERDRSSKLDRVRPNLTSVERKTWWDKFHLGRLSKDSAEYAWCEQLESDLLDEVSFNIKMGRITLDGEFFHRIMDYGRSTRRRDFFHNLEVEWDYVVHTSYQCTDAVSYSPHYCMRCYPTLTLSKTITQVEMFVDATLDEHIGSNDGYGDFFFERESYCAKCYDSLYFPIMKGNSMCVVTDITPKKKKQF